MSKWNRIVQIQSTMLFTGTNDFYNILSSKPPVSNIVLTHLKQHHSLCVKRQFVHNRKQEEKQEFLPQNPSDL